MEVVESITLLALICLLVFLVGWEVRVSSLVISEANVDGGKFVLKFIDDSIIIIGLCFVSWHVQ